MTPEERTETFSKKASHFNAAEEKRLGSSDTP
jgi:hypothetical protein